MTNPRKRSSRIGLTTMLVGAASISAAGCDQSWDQGQSAARDQVEAFAYRSLDACKTANEIPDAECDTAIAAAQKDDATNAPRYDERSTCEDVYGAGNCVPRSAANGGSFFTPLLAGFVVGQMLNGGGYRGTGLYQRRDDGYGGGGYYTGWGRSIGRDYSTGRTVIARDGIDPPSAIRQAPPRMQTRTSVVSRGGFGGGRSFGHGG